MVKRLKRFLVIVSGPIALILGAPLTALALDAPGGPEISSALAAELPPYWSIQSAEITTTVNEGDDVTPRYRQRFVAEAVPMEPLYLPVSDDRQIGPFEMLITTHAANQIRKLYGVATSVVALGKLQIDVSLVNSVLGVGMPKSLYAGPVVIAGAEETGKTAQAFLNLHELSKTVTEGMVRSTVSEEAIQKLAEQERAALEEASKQRLAALEEKFRQELVTFMAGVERERQQFEAASKVRLARLKAELEEETAALERRKTSVNQERKILVEESQRILDELAQKYREERAAFAAAAERERKQYAASNRKRLTALKSEIQKETSELDQQAAAMDRERKLLVDEHQRKLAALRAQYERKRAEVTAVSETLDAIARAEAETEAQKKFAAAQETLAAATRHATEAAQQARDAKLEGGKKKYGELVATLRSENMDERNTAFDAILDSEDEKLKAVAIAEAMKSADDALQAKALAALIVKSPRITVSLKRSSRIFNQLLEVTSVDKRNLSFSGRFEPSANIFTDPKRPECEPKGSGSVQRDKLTLSGSWCSSAIGRPPDRTSCTTIAQVDDTGEIVGVTTCDGDEYTAKVGL